MFLIQSANVEAKGLRAKKMKKNDNYQNTTNCTDFVCDSDNKYCPDGSIVARDPCSNCVFSNCTEDTDTIIDESPLFWPSISEITSTDSAEGLLIWSSTPTAHSEAAAPEKDEDSTQGENCQRICDNDVLLCPGSPVPNTTVRRNPCYNCNFFPCPLEYETSP